MTALQERSRGLDITESRHLAIQAGRMLTGARDRDRPEIVLSRAAPVEGWLLAAPGGDPEDMRTRRRAVMHHMAGLADAAAARKSPVACTPQELVAGAQAYYEALTRERNGS